METTVTYPAARHSSAGNEALMFVYEIRTLGSLPWPAGLGKGGGNYRDLAKLLRAHLGDEHHKSPQAHRHAFLNGDPEYRRIVLEQLSHQHWAADILLGYDAATDAARHAPLLNQYLPMQIEWDAWARPYLHAPAGKPVWYSLSDPITVNSRPEITGGRHRLTYLRYRRPADHEVIVCHAVDADTPPFTPPS